MNRLSKEKRVGVLASLVEGHSIRATVRMTDVAKNTVTKLLCETGTASAEYQDRIMRKLRCKRVQCDEIWSFCYAKAKNVPTAKAAPAGAGSIWTWVAMDADTKLVPCWAIGERNADTALKFMLDLAGRIVTRTQLTTDGLKCYIEAVEGAFGFEVDYAQLQKIYDKSGKAENPETRYSPGECCGTKVNAVTGLPDKKHVSTSYVERQNLTMRMSMRRFTGLTNVFSKKVENLMRAVSLHFMHYNFCRKHQSLKTTPAVAAGVADHVWSLEEVVALLENAE